MWFELLTVISYDTGNTTNLMGLLPDLLIILYLGFFGILVYVLILLIKFLRRGIKYLDKKLKDHNE